MLRLAITLLAALTFALTACDSGPDEVLPGNPVTQSPTPNTIGDTIIICPRIGVPGEATPSSPTPEPSCAPGDDRQDVGTLMTGRVGVPPPLPSGVVSLTDFEEFDIVDPPLNAVVGLALKSEIPVGRDLGWYTYDSGQWRALDVTVQIHTSTTSGQGGMASGNFDPVPPNLILLAEP